MWNAIEEMAVSLTIALLRVIIKSPEAVTKEGSIVAQIAQLSTEADMAVNGNVWSMTPSTPAPAPSR